MFRHECYVVSKDEMSLMSVASKPQGWWRWELLKRRRSARACSGCQGSSAHHHHRYYYYHN